MNDVALIHIRKSVVRHEEDRASPERQLANCVRVCDEKGWRYEVYEDAEGHRSRRSEKHRPAWRRLKADLASDRGRGSIDHRRRRGVHVGIPPFGYDREDGKLVVNEDAAVVRLAQLF